MLYFFTGCLFICVHSTSGGSSGPVVCSLKPASENHHLSLRILFEFDSSNAMSRLPQMLVINEDEEDIKYWNCYWKNVFIQYISKLTIFKICDHCV